MNFNVITIFPEFIDGFRETGFIKRAIGKNIISINVINLRNFSTDKHKRVDDRPYGGGPGMVLQYEPIKKALLSLNPDFVTLILYLRSSQFFTRANVEKLSISL